MKKRILSLLVAMAIMLSFVTVIANAEDMKYGDYLYYTVNSDNTVTITKCDKSAEKVRIPSEIDGMSVTTIGYNAFHDCTSLIRVEIPKSIKRVDRQAIPSAEEVFYLGSREEWEQVDVDPYYLDIDQYAVIGGNRAIQPDSDAMRYNTPMPDDDETVALLEYLKLDRSTGTIQSCDKNIEGNLVIPSKIDRVKITAISDLAFHNCDKLTGISLPDGITTIEENTFSYLKSLASVDLPDSVTSIGDGAFSGCNVLTSIHLSENLESIGEGAFSNTALTSLFLPDSVKSIGYNAFGGCKALTSIHLSKNLESIGGEAFAGCSALESLRLPGSITSIDEYVFDDCSMLKNVYIEDGITSIGETLFSWCESLTNIRLPKSLVKVEDSAFSLCDNIEKVYYLGDSSSWKKIDIGDDNMPLQGDAEIIYGEMPAGLIVEAEQTPRTLVAADTPSSSNTAPAEEIKPTKNPDDVSVTLNGNGIVFNQPPVIIEGRTLVPMRAIFEAMGCSVEWEGETKTIKAFNANGEKVIEMQVGSTDMWSVSNPSITLDVPPQIINDRTLVPVRAISESMGAEVNWDSDTRNVEIIYN